MRFTFLSPNYIDSVDDIYLWDGFSTTALNGYTEGALYDRDKFNTLDVSMPAANDLVIEFAPTDEIVADTLIIQNCNFKNYYIGVNHSLSAVGVTAGTDENIYHEFSAPHTITSVSIHIASLTSGDIAQIGQMIVASKQYELTRNPNFSAYEPKLIGLRIEKEMADKGTVTYKADEKFQARIGLSHVSQTVADTIKDMYRTLGAYLFVPWATTAVWDGEAYEVNMAGDYNFKHDSNDLTIPYYMGDIVIKETPR